MSKLGLPMATVICLGVLGCGSKEEVVEVRTSPDKKFKLIITKTEEHWPYGVEGYLYISNLAEDRKRRVADYFTDDLGELDAFIEWDDTRKTYVYSGKMAGDVLINLEHTPLE